MLLFASIASLPVAHAAAPVAEAGLGLVAYVGDTVELNGSGSSDEDGDHLSYDWSQVGGPPVELTGATNARPRFDVTAPGTLRFQLVVNDGQEDSEPDVVEFVVPYESIEGVEAGCAAVPGAASLGAPLLALAACLARRRR